MVAFLTSHLGELTGLGVLWEREVFPLVDFAVANAGSPDMLTALVAHPIGAWLQVKVGKRTNDSQPSGLAPKETRRPVSGMWAVLSFRRCKWRWIMCSPNSKVERGHDGI